MAWFQFHTQIGHEIEGIGNGAIHHFDAIFF